MWSNILLHSSALVVRSGEDCALGTVGTKCLGSSEWGESVLATNDVWFPVLLHNVMAGVDVRHS